MLKLTPEKLTAFCAALAETCQVSKACAAIGISRTTAYEWRDEIPDFAERWDKALKIGTSVLEDEAVRRAHEGWDEPVFYKGGECGTVRKYSDTLLIFTLKAHDPEKYRDRSDVNLKANVAVTDMTDAEILAELTALGLANLIAQPDDECDLA